MTASHQLGARQKLLLVIEVTLAYARVRRLLREQSVPEVLAQLRAAPVRGDTADLPSAVRLGRVVRRVLRFLPGDTRCLTQSLVLTGLLARRGVESSLVIAVSSSGGFGAHAWVEREGRPLLPPGARYEPIVQL